MYNHSEIEPKWQKIWEKHKAFAAKDNDPRPKFYGLIEFPYPSGDGLHVGHLRSNTAMDIIARKRRMEGYNVLYPIGFDSFGLPTENYAIKTGRPPAEITKENIANFTKQLKSLGFSFDWDRAVTTSDPAYYKWTQWIFLQFFKHGLAYKKKMAINWCPSCKIGLANEEVVQKNVAATFRSPHGSLKAAATQEVGVGVCERCGTPVEKREKEQWMLAITKYADKLLEGLKEVDYIDRAKVQQENWIGRSEGALLKFSIVRHSEEPRDEESHTMKQGTGSFAAAQDDKLGKVEVFTTRPDTLFGVTYLVLAPEHPLLRNHELGIRNDEEVKEYIDNVRNKTEQERTAEGKEKTGVELKGVKAINPANKEEIPIWVADYVLAGYGTGVIMAVPQHDERDREFAEKFNLPIVDKPLINGDEIIKKVGGVKKVQYKLRDWVFSRQRYWGEPIPLVWCDKCNEWVPLPDDQLPLELPKVEKYQPTDTGESPLAGIEKWVKTKCPRCGGAARRETDTMPNWAGSSWYFLRYCDPQNDKEFASMEKLKYWMGTQTVIASEAKQSPEIAASPTTAPRNDGGGSGGVNWYNGGMEHTVLHLLYSRFWNQFLYDIGLVPTREPYKKRTSHGLILASDGEKMSKSRGNVINPNEIVEKYGADVLRVYEMFMGPFDQAVPWSTKSIAGVRRFLERIWNLQERVEATFRSPDGSLKAAATPVLDRFLHRIIKKVTEDIEAMKYNTAIAAMMTLVNELSSESIVRSSEYEALLKLLSPFAPHICEELWERVHNAPQPPLTLRGGGVGLLCQQPWPQYDPALIKEETIELVVQINGKVRDRISAAADISEDEAKALALGSDKVKKWLDGQKVKDVIFVKGKLLNIVTK